MKSLKRTLCLVLALVMVLGLFGIASASSFTDDNAIQYKEAVDVMTAIGAINGYNDGSFGPKGTITRAEAAKLVTYAVIGADAAKGLTGVASSFSDVTVEGGYGWAIPCIEYLVKAGVINGMGDGTFNPAGNISGYAVLKMLLCAIGYGAKGEYVGTGWDLQVAIDASRKETSLTAGRIDTNKLSDPATREEVALYCLNAIQAPMVKYLSTLDAYISNTGTLGSGDAIKIMGTVYPTLAKVDAGDTASGGPLNGRDGVDAFGAPATLWAYKGQDIGTYPAEAAFTFTTAQKAEDLTKLLAKYTVSDSVTPKVNGDNGNALANKAAVLGDGGIKFDSSDDTQRTGNGTVVKLYASDPLALSDIDTIIVINTVLTKVAVNNAVAKSVTLSKVAGAIDQGSYTITAEAQPELYAKVAGLAVDDLVLVTPVHKDTAYVAAAVNVPTPVTGKVAKVTSDGVISLENGQSYLTAAVNDFSDTARPDVGNDVTLLLDTMGNVVHWKAAEDAAPAVTYGFALDSYSTLINNRIVSMAKIVFADGEIRDVPAVVNPSGTPAALTKGTYYKLTDTTATINVWTGEAVTTTAGTAPVAAEAGGTTAKAAAGELVLLRDYDATADSNAGSGIFKSTDKQLTKSTNGNGTNFYSNFYDAGIKFIVISQDSTTGAYSATVATGAQNATTAASTTKSLAVIGEAVKDKDPTPVVKAVFINKGKVSGATDPSKIMFIPKVDEPTKVSIMGADGKAHTYDNFTVLVNGAPLAGGATIANKAEGATTSGFYTFAESKTVKGAYDIEALSSGGAFAPNNVAGIADASNSHAPYFKITGVAGDGLVDLSSATIVDIRPATAQADAPITATPAGLQKALVNSNLTLGVLYDATKGNLASVVYICNASAPTELTMPTVAAVTGKTEAGTWSVAKANAGDTVTLSVKATDAPANGLKLTVTNAKIMSCSVTQGTIAADGLSVVIPKANVAANDVITFTIWLNATSAPTGTVTDANS